MKVGDKVILAPWVEDFDPAIYKIEKIDGDSSLKTTFVRSQEGLDMRSLISLILVEECWVL